MSLKNHIFWLFPRWQWNENRPFHVQVVAPLLCTYILPQATTGAAGLTKQLLTLFTHPQGVLSRPLLCMSFFLSLPKGLSGGSIDPHDLPTYVHLFQVFCCCYEAPKTRFQTAIGFLACILLHYTCRMQKSKAEETLVFRAGGPQAHIIFSTIDYSIAAYKVIIFSLVVSRLNIREVRGSEVQGHWGGNSCAFGFGFSSTPDHPELPPPSNPPNPIPQDHEFPPHWP